MTPSQEQYDCTLQQFRDLEIQVLVKDRKLNTIDVISGLVESGNISIDADSDIRRTINITMLLSSDFTLTESGLVTQDYSEYWQSGNVYWFDKFIQIQVGINSLTEKKVIWHNLGYYMINTPSISFDAETNSLSFQGVDLMAYFTGLRNGQLEGVEFIIPQGSDIVQVISNILDVVGITKSILYTPVIDKTPYEIRIDIGGTIYDLLVQLRDINSNWEMYFDEECTFVFKQIPTGNPYKVGQIQTCVDGELIPTPSLTDYELEKLMLDWQLDTDFENVKNYIEVIGKMHEPNIYATSTQIDPSNSSKLIIEVPDLDLTQVPPKIDGREETVLNWTIAFTIGDASLQPQNDNLGLMIFNLKCKNGGFLSGDFINPTGDYMPININNNTYVMRVTQLYNHTTKQQVVQTELLGGLQARGIAYENNPDSPFYVGKAQSNVIRLVCSGGEYDNIYSDDLAFQRAKYELYLHSQSHDSISINLVPVYWLGVNELIQFTPKRLYQEEVIEGIDEQYFWLVKSISIDLSVEGTQTITAVKYYSEIPST